MLLTHYWKLLRSDSNHDIVKSSRSEATVHQCLWFLYWRVIAWTNKLHLLILSIILPLLIIAQEKKSCHFKGAILRWQHSNFLKPHTLNTYCFPTSMWVVWSDPTFLLAGIPFPQKSLLLKSPQTARMCSQFVAHPLGRSDPLWDSEFSLIFWGCLRGVLWCGVWQNQPPLSTWMCHPHTANTPPTGGMEGFCPLISSHLKSFSHRPVPRKAKQQLSTV